MQFDSRLGLRGRLIKGFGAQGLQLAVRIAQQIFLVPLLINAWGKELYTDWIVLFAAAGLVPMLELGTQAYFGNRLLASWASGARAEFDRTLGVALGVQGAIVVFACAAGALSTVSVDWPHFLGTKAMSGHESLAILGILAAGNLATVPQGVVSTVYRARGEFSRLVNVVTLLLALETAGMAVTVVLGGSPLATAMIYTGAIVVTWVLLVVDQRRRYRDLRYRFSRPRRAEWSDMVATAPFYLVNSTTATIVTNGPIVVLQSVAPGAAIVAFSLSRLLVGILRQLTHQLAHASGVEMARQLIQGERSALRQLFGETGRFGGGVFGLLGGPLVVGAALFFQIWTRGNVAFEPWLFAILMANVFLILPGQAALTFLYYSNQPRAISTATGTHALGGLMLCAVLGASFGAIGAALAMTAAEWIMIGLWLARAGAREIGVPLLPYLASTYASAAVSFSMSYTAARIAFAMIRPHGLADLMVFGLLWSALATIPAFYLLLNRRQRAWALDLASRRVGRWRNA